MSAARVRPRLAAVWLTLFALVGVIVAVERAGPGSGEAHEAALLLPVPLPGVGAIEIGHDGVLHRFERSEGGEWLHRVPHGGAPAAAARIAGVLAAFGRTRIERRIPAEVDPARYGLAAPRTVLLVFRANEPQPAAQFALGDLAPDQLSRYVLRIGASEVVTIPDYQVENLLSLLR